MAFRDLADTVANELRSRNSVTLDENEVRAALRNPNFKLTIMKGNEIACHYAEIYNEIAASTETMINTNTGEALIFLIFARGLEEFAKARKELQNRVENHHAGVVTAELIRPHVHTRKSRYH